MNAAGCWWNQNLFADGVYNQGCYPRVNFLSLNHIEEIIMHANWKEKNMSRRIPLIILLAPGQTVTSVVRDNVVAAFRQAGFRTVTDPREAGGSPMIVDVHVKQLWAWMQPGFWAITLKANVETDLKSNKSSSPVTVSAHAEQSGMAATDSSWVEVLDAALKDYRDKVAKEYANLQ
jgi:hypothetical protein